MRKFILNLATCAGIVLMMNSAFADQDDILKKIEDLQKQITEQQAMIDSLRAQIKQSSETVNTMVREEVKQEVEKGIAQSKSSARLNLGKGIEGLRLTGDARYRYERSEHDRPGVSSSNLDRHRTRFRLGAVWNNPDENWEIGAGAATGDGNATSTNATWSNANVFETGDLRLDYAYAQHKWKNTKITLGQQKNPFETSFLYWDGDVRPAGLTVQSDLAPFFVTAGAYQVRYFNGSSPNGVNAENAGLFAGQVGTKVNLAENLKWMLALGFQHFDSNTSRNSAPALHRDYRFQIGDLYSTLDTRIGDVKLGVFGHVWKNFGADGTANTGQIQFAGNTDTPDDNDLGWVLGLDAALGRVKLGYAYGRVEADSVYTAIKDGDFGASTSGMNNTDIKGHKLGANYAFTKNFSLGATAVLVQEVNGPERDGKLFHLDANYKF